jgi:protein-tyrosine-phosphatase
MRLLFVCTQNRLRSPTAEQVFSQWPGIECSSAGVHSSADVPLDGELIEWADIIFVMERVHKTKMASRFKKSIERQAGGLSGYSGRLCVYGASTGSIAGDQGYPVYPGPVAIQANFLGH